jgi:hypothetical protein
LQVIWFSLFEEFGRISAQKEARDKKKHRIKLFPVYMEVQHCREKQSSDSKLTPLEERLFFAHLPAFLQHADCGNAKNANKKSGDPFW